MAGHSKYANTKHRKASQDEKKSKICTKLARSIVFAAKSGIPDPERNGRLKIAIYNARKEGLAKDKIERALKSASGEIEGEDYEEIFYEGYAGDGIALIIHSLTNNRNRTASDLRYILSRNGGDLAESGSVKFLFENLGMIIYKDTELFINPFDVAVEVDASDVKIYSDFICFYTKKNDLSVVRDTLCAKFGQPNEVRLGWMPLSCVSLNEEQKMKIADIIEDLNDNDDVQHVDTNVIWDD